MTEIIRKIKGYKSLLYLGDKIVLAKLNKIFVADFRLEKLDYICQVGATNTFVRFISRFRLVQRLFRLELGPAVALNQKGCFLVFYRNQAFHVNTNLCVAMLEDIPGLKHKPLQLTRSKSSKSAGSIYCGDYTPNFGYGPANIYRRDVTGAWFVIFKFPSGQINHIHGIFEDIDRGCFYVLTGDFDQGACIWLANQSFTEVTPLVRSGQSSRACWILPWEDRLVFATDQQANCNYLCEITGLKEGVVSKRFPIVGSSIYFSSSHSDPIIFSTSVEPESSNKLSAKSLFLNQRAAGILSDNSCIYAGSPGEGFEIIFSAKKDWLPSGLFQFGNISFPAGDSYDKTFLHFYCMSLKKSDGTTYAIKLNKEQLA
jgi:hypothetical protein